MSIDFLGRRPLLGGHLSAPPSGAAFLLHHAGARFGRPLASVLPLADANGELLQTAAAALRSAGPVPLLAGVCATDPTRIAERLLDDVAKAGFAGVVNWPSVGLFDGVFRSNLESTGLGYGREVDLIAQAAKRKMAAIGLVFTADEARRMAEAGAHAVVVHPGPSGGLDPAPAEEVAKAARRVRPDLAVLAAAERSMGLDGCLTGLVSP
ncbi:MAG TPA: phosphoenolpyruvate hydrolase family protein [Planctomycetota bacterium]|nr:phosphoenolpyruvate hydrolase family protein [Planctomycetota bacterium]